MTCLSGLWRTWVDVDETQLEGAARDHSGTSREEIQSHYVFKKGALAARLRAQHCDSRQRDFLIETVVPHLVDNVDQLTDILEQIRLQKLSP